MKDLSINLILERIGAEKRINYSLDRFKAALAYVGNPEKNVYSLVISGTNGKGTTTLLTSSALVQAGIKTATYLSPHLQHPKERFLLNMETIEEAELDDLAREYYPIAEKFELSYFEFLTLLFFQWANREGVELVVLEVGLGGRLDATNVTRPLACALTSIGFDHQAYLGNSLSEILNEKLGVLPPESLLFTGITDETLLAQLETRCNELDSIYYYSKEIKTELRNISWARQSFYLNGYPFTLSTPMAGARSSAATAFLLLRIAFPRIPIEAIQRGFSRVVIPGRMECVQTFPRVVLSGDHNPDGIECLIQTLEEMEVRPDKILCAFSLDKPYVPMFEALKGITSDLTLTTLNPSADVPDDYLALGVTERDASRALAELLDRSQPSDTILVTGSLYLVGQLRKQWYPEVSYVLPRLDQPTRLSSIIGTTSF